MRGDNIESEPVQRLSRIGNPPFRRSFDSCETDITPSAQRDLKCGRKCAVLADAEVGGLAFSPFCCCFSDNPCLSDTRPKARVSWASNKDFGRQWHSVLEGTSRRSLTSPIPGAFSKACEIYVAYGSRERLSPIEHGFRRIRSVWARVKRAGIKRWNIS